MDFFIKKIFDGKSDELVHLQFQKFSRGDFTKRALIKASNSKNGFSINTSNEFANELVRAVAEKLGNSKAKISGVIVSTSDLTGKLQFSDKKQFMGIKQYVIDSEMTGNDIIKLCDNFPECFFALTFNVGDTELKIKPKAPKSAKPSTKNDDEIKPDFCKLKTTDVNLVKQFVWEKDFKNATVEHTFAITDISVPKDAKTPEEMRKLAKRKGKVIRKLVIDGTSMTKEMPFEA